MKSLLLEKCPLSNDIASEKIGQRYTQSIRGRIENILANDSK